MERNTSRNLDPHSLDPQSLAPATQAIRLGHRRTEEREHSDAIFTTSSFVFDSAAQAAACFAGEEDGNVYSRFTNPSVRLFEERMAALEGGERAVATASGMAAILSLCMALLRQGDHLVSSRSLFGSTISLFDNYLRRAGIETTFIDPVDTRAWRAALRPNTRLCFLETPSNPLAEVVDISALADIVHEAGAWLVVDNCFCTPVLQKPLSLGADIVMHSATKFLDGQGRCVGGVLVGPEKAMEDVFGFVRTGGACMSPFNAWVFAKGLETLELRIQAQSEKALSMARWLNAQPGVEKVYYAGLEDHPQHELAARQQSAFGAVLAFEVQGGRAEAWRFIDATRLVSITGNLGDVKTTIVHPATTTHGRLSEAERQAAGIRENLIRLSLGLEADEDLRADMVRGLKALE